MKPCHIEPQQHHSIASLKKRADFLRVRSGDHCTTGTLVLQARASGKKTCDGLRVGLTVTNRTGNSVERNRIKRKLRAAVKAVFPDAAHSGFDYVIIGKRRILHAGFQALKNDMKLALDRIHSNRAKGT